MRWLGHETANVASRSPRSRWSASHGEASGARCVTSAGNLSSMRLTTAGQTGEITGAGPSPVAARSSTSRRSASSYGMHGDDLASSRARAARRGPWPAGCSPKPARSAGGTASTPPSPWSSPGASSIVSARGAQAAMQQVQSMQTWSITDGRASRTRTAAVGQATRQWRQSRHSSGTVPSDEGRAPWSAASGRSITEKLTRVPSPTVDVTRMRSLLRSMLGRPMPAPKPSARASAGGGGEALVHRPRDVRDARPAVDDVDVELAVAHGGFEATAVGVDDDVHLGLVGGDHGAAHGVRLRADPLEVLLEVAGGRARAVEVTAADVVVEVLQGQLRASPPRWA